MNQKLKKILSYIGVGLIGAVLGIGSLIAVSSCASKSKDLTKASAEYIESSDVYDYLWSFNNDLTRYSTEIEFDSENSLFYRNSYFANLSTGWHNNAIFFIQDSMLFYGQDIPEPYNTMRFQIDIYKGATSDLDKYYLRSIRIQANVGRDSYVDSRLYPNITLYDNFTITKHINFRFNNEFDDLWFGKGNLDHVVIAFTDGLSKGIFDFMNYYFITTFDFVHTLDYTFLTDFNYNAFIQFDINSNPTTSLNIRYKYPFVASSLPDGDTEIYVTFPFSTFISNNRVFNYIKATIDIATTDLRFESPSGYLQTQLIDNKNPYSFISKLSFGNSNSNYEIQVAARNPYLDENKNTIIPYDMVWVNNEYRFLKFDETLKDYNRDLLSMCNNNAYNYSGFEGATYDVGLGGVFTLISSAFKGFIPIFQIQVIPGITIGLLMFLPLITGIILLVIWIVKR